MAEDLEGYLHRKRVDEAARYARKKAEKDAQAAAQAPGQVGVSADVVDLQAVRAPRTAEAPQVIEQIEQVDQPIERRSLDDSDTNGGQEA